MKKQSNKRTVIFILSAVAAFLVVIFVACYFLIGGISSGTDTETYPAKAETTKVQAYTENLKTEADSKTENKTVITTNAQTEIQQSQKLTDALEKSGLTYDALSNSKQLLLVHRSNGAFRLCCFENQNGVWNECMEAQNAYIGLNGTVSAGNKTEGDRKTPLGLYTLGFAFGTADSINTELEYRKITSDIYWVDDVNSEHYNQWVDSSKVQKTWNSAEHMIEYSDSYEYGIVVNFNTNPIVKGKGSAIFIHCGEHGTYGCVSLKKDNLVNILNWLKRDANAQILITD